MSFTVSRLGLFALASTVLAAPHGSGNAGNAVNCTFPSGAGWHVHHHHRYCMHKASGSEVMNDAPVNSDEVAKTATEYTTFTSTMTVTVTSTRSAASDTPASSSSPSAAAASSSASAPPVESSPGLNVGKNVVEQQASPSSYSSAPAPSASSSPSGCLRGIPYNDVQYTTAFSGKKISWAYNWGSSAGDLGSGFEYVPMLWGTDTPFSGPWKSNANKAIAAGSTHLLGFNEPDLTEQANLSPDAAATAYKTYLSDMFGGKNIRLGAPAVTNGGAPMGLTWLGNFMTACSGCQIDFVPIHWYDSAANVEYFKSHVEQAHQQTGKPIWITELGASGSDDEVNAFLQTVLPWLDSQPYVERVAYFMAKDGKLNSGGGLSSYGTTFATV